MLKNNKEFLDDSVIFLNVMSGDMVAYHQLNLMRRLRVDNYLCRDFIITEEEDSWLNGHDCYTHHIY